MDLKLIATAEKPNRNGYRPSCITLYHGWNEYTPWVTFLECGPDEINKTGRDRMYGHYFQTEDEAWEDFRKRTAGVENLGVGLSAEQDVSVRRS